jgi:Nucleotidyl transferase AbiEii toxin, Type IV TA system
LTVYATPAALRAALEARLLRESREKGVDLQRLRRRAVFERLLVRLDLTHPSMWVVKGGIALEVRMQELDIVSRAGEISETEQLPLPGVLSFAGFPTHEIEVVARERHFAEKLHAMTRIYADRPSSRVRDLADLILMIDEGFDDLPKLRGAVDAVFEARATHPVPVEIPDAPESWRPTFADIASELDIGPKGLDEAMGALRRFWLGVRKETRAQR